MAFSLLRSGKHPAPAVETGLWGTSMFAAANLTAFLLGAGLFVWFLSGPCTSPPSGATRC